VAAHLDGLAELTGPDATGERVGALAGVLAALARGYRDHAAVAVGPADGPVAASLALARARTEGDLASLGVAPEALDLALP
jgi:hypothetical protein